MKLKNKRILITGGTGLVGRHVTELLLDAGAEVISFTRRKRSPHRDRLTYIECDLKDLRERGKACTAPVLDPVDYIIYIAASIPQFNEEKETIVTAKENTFDPFLYFLELYGTNAPRIILTSTIDIYGYPASLQFTEDTAIDPPTPYALAKHACEEYLRFYAKTEKKEYVILRFSQVYGPDEPFVRVIPFIIDAALRDKTFTIWGNPRNRRRFLYAQDAARAVIASLGHGTNDVFHIAGPEEIAIDQVVTTVEDIMGKEITVIHKQEDAAEVHIVPSTKKAERLLGFKPVTSFRQGITSVIDTNHEKSGKK